MATPSKQWRQFQRRDCHPRIKYGVAMTKWVRMRLRTPSEGYRMTRNLPAADWTSKFVEANGIRRHYLEWGDASKPALLMLRATGLCAWPWKPVARELAQDYRVLAFDQRGHGDTDRSDRGYRFEFVGDDLAAIVEKPDLERPRVIGHSSGGLAAVLAANLIPADWAR